jgi:FkbM family methyltransferase
MIDKFYEFYGKHFARRSLYRLNKFLYLLSLRGMGLYGAIDDQNSTGAAALFLQRLSGVWPKNATIIDVGANVGHYSGAVLDLASHAHVYAFEPHPLTFETLAANLAKKAEALNFGCGSLKGKANLYDYRQSDGSTHATLHREVFEKIYRSRVISHEVNVIRLDDFIKQRKIKRVDLLKIDTEGNELEVLKGVKKSLERGIIDVIHFEFNSINVVSRSFLKDFIELLPDCVMARLLPDGPVVLGNYTPVTHEIFAYQNLIAVRRDAVDILSALNMPIGRMEYD